MVRLLDLQGNQRVSFTPPADTSFAPPLLLNTFSMSTQTTSSPAWLISVGLLDIPTSFMDHWQTESALPSLNQLQFTHRHPATGRPSRSISLPSFILLLLPFVSFVDSALNTWRTMISAAYVSLALSVSLLTPKPGTGTTNMLARSSVLLLIRSGK